jgi:hypothetical protein
MSGYVKHSMVACEALQGWRVRYIIYGGSISYSDYLAALEGTESGTLELEKTLLL